MIPKVIHYCWFGRGELPALAVKCIASWKRFLPGYEIREWNEDNFDVNIIPYTAEAYKAGKYARFWVLYRYGGVYFDTDVEVIKPLDCVIENGPFMGLEFISARDSFAVAPGLGLAAEPGMDLYREILDQFGSLHYNLDNGERNPFSMIPLVTDLLTDKGLKGNGSIEQISGITVYPPDWFNPFDDATGRMRITENTQTIHWYAKSWLPEEPAWKVSTKRMVRRLVGTDTLLKLKSFLQRG